MDFLTSLTGLAIFTTFKSFGRVFLAGFMEIRIPQEIGQIANWQVVSKRNVAKIRHHCPVDPNPLQRHMAGKV